MKRHVLGLDIGSNSVGSTWFDRKTGSIATGISVFPAGVDESDDKRGDPKNAKRRLTRRTRITLARRASRKRELRLRLIADGLLPPAADAFKRLLEETDPWELRRKGLDERLSPFEFGRVLLHLAQRRGALGLHIEEPEEEEGKAPGADAAENAKVKRAIGEIRAKMLARSARTFGEFIAMVRAERVTPLATEDRRREDRRNGPREYRNAVRNKAGSYEHCADRPMIRDEFARLWDAQARLGGPVAALLTPELRKALDDDAGDSTWRHKGLLFGQRRATWDLGTLGRCVLEPSERCVPHADRHASYYRVVETVNNLRIVEGNKPARPLTAEERQSIKDFLRGPLGTLPAKAIKDRAVKGKVVKRKTIPERPKSTVTVTDLREHMGWGKRTKHSRVSFNIEADEDREINTDWFHREIAHGAVGIAKWNEMEESLKEGINRAILRFDPDEAGDAERLKAGVRKWAGLSEAQAEALIAAWKRRPKPDAKRLNMSRRAVLNLLTKMDGDGTGGQWPTQIAARKLIAEDGDFVDLTTGKPMDDHTRRRYATGAKGATARDRHYMGKHTLMKGGKPVIGPDGRPLAEPPPAPLISNPVVRKAIHEVRRHLIEYMTTFGRSPDEVYIELAREARMGATDADRLLFKNRLRNRIRNDIARTFHLEVESSTQQRAAVDRVILCVQQGGRCPLCGENGLTELAASKGDGCEVAHIIPRASGGHNGLGNIVLSHAKCNRDMGRRTPRQFWEGSKGFEAGVRWVEGIYGKVERPRFSETRTATGRALWSCYFTTREDSAKIEQFKKDVKDIQEMTNRQEAATKYAARQVMSYLADALYGGKGLPERSTGSGAADDERRIFASDGMWTSRFRREWGLFFDPHLKKAKGLSNSEEGERKEKDRGDHRHHAIDAVVIGLCTQQVRNLWDKRERDAAARVTNPADEMQMEAYRRANPIPPPEPYPGREEFRAAVRRAVYGDGDESRPVCHRPVKRKLIGALHEETLFGPVLDRAGQLTGNYTARKSVISLASNHLRMPRAESPSEAVERLAARRVRERGVDERSARKWAKEVVESTGYRPTTVDPPPSKSGIVRDVALRARLRDCLREAGLDPDDFSPNQIKKLHESGGVRHASGVPIRSVVLLRTMSDPVIIDRRRPDHATGRMVSDDNPASRRAYVGGNNHHIEVRVDARGRWTGEIVPAFEAAQRKLARLRELRAACIPKPAAFRALPVADKARLKPILRGIEAAHPIVDRRDDDAKGGRFVMSLCEGEMLWMRHKTTDETGFFVVAKLDKPRSVVLVPHFDARAAGERKDSEGRKVEGSRREQFAVTPDDLSRLAPPGHPHAMKVRVSPLGVITLLQGD